MPIMNLISTFTFSYSISVSCSYRTDQEQKRHIRVRTSAYVTAWGLTSFVCALLVGRGSLWCPTLNINNLPYRGYGNTKPLVMKIEINPLTLPENGQNVIFQLHTEHRFWHEGAYNAELYIFCGVNDDYHPYEVAIWQPAADFTERDDLTAVRKHPITRWSGVFYGILFSVNNPK